MDTLAFKPYVDLADAIILQAVKDYRKALIGGRTAVIKSCERFFRSEWFNILTSADGEMIMNKIRKEALNESTTHTTNK